MLVYKVICTVNDKVYIGQTSKTLQYRKRKHLNAANSGSEYAFHRAIRKHGADSFVWSVAIESLDKSIIDAAEKTLIAENVNNYNMTAGGEGLLGWKHSQQTKLKISEGHSNKVFFRVIKDNQLIGTWSNQSKCARDLKISQAHISSCLLKKRPQHCGYLFEFVENA